MLGGMTLIQDTGGLDSLISLAKVFGDSTELTKQIEFFKTERDKTIKIQQEALNTLKSIDIRQSEADIREKTLLVLKDSLDKEQETVNLLRANLASIQLSLNNERIEFEKDKKQNLEDFQAQVKLTTDSIKHSESQITEKRVVLDRKELDLNNKEEELVRREKNLINRENELSVKVNLAKSVLSQGFK